jgi:hypothetical protein
MLAHARLAPHPHLPAPAPPPLQRHDRTLSGLLGKRTGGGLTENAKEQHDSLGLGPGGADTLTRYFSSPQPSPQLEAPGGVRKTTSGVSSDDLAVLHSLDTDALLRGGECGHRARVPGCVSSP